MSTQTVARRYASALADVVLKNGETSSIRSELGIWSEMVAANPDLGTAFGNPAIARLTKEKVLEKLIVRAQPSKTTANFLRVLLQNGRLGDLDGIIERFDKVVEERSGVVAAEVTSARELGSTEKAEIEANVAKAVGSKVKLEFKVDADIIGGVVTRIGSTVYDGSVRTQLENLKQQLVNG
jgi:F-type H+-transporting ATPase subunit delta